MKFIPVLRKAKWRFGTVYYKAIPVIPLDEACVDMAALINLHLKRKRKQIDLADLLIAATAVTHKLIFQL